MPSYDRTYFLRYRSIPSVLRQTYSNWELLVVGDGPQDDGIQNVVKSFGDSRIRYFEIPRPEYSSLSRKEFWFVAGAQARNHGLDHAVGDFFCPLDDDDEFLPNHLEDCVNALRDSRFDLVYGPALFRDLEAGTEMLQVMHEQPRFYFEDRILHSTVGYSARFHELRYPLDRGLPDDAGLWGKMFHAGAKIGRLRRPQSISYGETFLTSSNNETVLMSYRLSVPSLPSTSGFLDDVKTICNSRSLSNRGSYCRRFEKGLEEYVGRPVLSAPSGDIALLIALATLKAEIGNDHRREVILPSYTHPSTANGLLWNGFEPVFCDVDERTLCITPELVDPLLGPRVIAILPVYAHGNPCDMPTLELLAHEKRLKLVTDASAAFGAEISGRRAGSFGDLEVFSFSGTKVLTCGEGGGICFRNTALYETARCLGQYGTSENYVAVMKGMNGKLAELPAALGLANLETFQTSLSNRRRAAERYRYHFRDLTEFRMQHTFSPVARSSEKDFALIFDSPQKAQNLVRRLASYRIDTRPYYRPLHNMPAFAHCRHGNLENTERIADCVVCIPLYNEIRNELVDMVAGIVADALGGQIRLADILGHVTSCDA